MKKVVKLFTFLVMLLASFTFNLVDVDALSGEITLNSNKDLVCVDEELIIKVKISEDGNSLESWQVNISHSNNLSLISGEEIINDTYNGELVTEKIYELKYKAISQGEAKVNVDYITILDYDTKEPVDIIKKENVIINVNKKEETRGLLKSNQLNGFITKDNNVYYYVNGQMQKGIVKINNDEYFLGYLTGILKKNTFVDDLEGNTYHTDQEGKIQKGIIKINDKEYFFGYLTGILKKNTFVDDINGNTYHTNKEGIVQKGIIKVNDNEYFFGCLTGILKKNTFVDDLEGNAYHTNKEGKVQKGIIQVDGKEYFLGYLTGILKKDIFVDDLEGNTYHTAKDGQVQKGFVEINKNSYYFNSNGQMQKGIVKINDKEYFLGCLTGILKINTFVDDIEGNTYYTDKSGQIQKGFIKIEKNEYYFNEKGVMEKGLTSIGENDYFLGCLTGILKKNVYVDDINGNTYHTDKDGIVQKGIIKINDKEYFFGYLTGILKRNEFVNDLEGNTYHTTKDGQVQKGIVSVNGDDYFLGYITGILKKNMYEYDFDNNKYYMDENGKVQKGIIVIDGKRYFFGCLTGILKMNTFVTDLNNNVYYTNGEGIIQTGIQVIDGVSYNFGSDGVLQSGYQTINGKTYYYYSDGSLAKGVVKIQGERNYFDFTTGELLRRNVKSIIDVSYGQGTINWDELWASGQIDGVIIRVGYGTSTVDNPVQDSYFAYNIAAVKRLGIPYSVYIFGYAQTTYAAEKEALFVANTLNNYGATNLSMPIFYDAEISNWRGVDYNSTLYTNVITAFSNKLNSLGFNNVGVYGSYSWFTDLGGRLNSPTIRSYPIWVAQYYRKCSYTDSHIGWQYTSSGSLPGISTRVDMNIFY